MTAIFPAPACVCVGLPCNELTFSCLRWRRGLPLIQKKAFKGQRFHAFQKSTPFFDVDLSTCDLLQCVLPFRSILNVILSFCVFTSKWNSGVFHVTVQFFLQNEPTFQNKCRLFTKTSVLILVTLRCNWSPRCRIWKL